MVPARPPGEMTLHEIGQQTGGKPVPVGYHLWLLGAT
jgi:hypothetical protein